MDEETKEKLRNNIKNALQANLAEREDLIAQLIEVNNVPSL